jgi:hypothetical protein
VRNSDKVDFYVSIIDNSTHTHELEQLSLKFTNLIIVHRPNLHGYDLCTHLNTLQNRTADYDYFIMLNSGSRGPFVRKPVTDPLDWIAPFTAKLKERVKLVGSTLSCAFHPHIQSWFLVTDRTGIQIVMKAWRNCSSWRNVWDAITFGDIGLSKEIMQNGFTIASMQTRHWTAFAGSCDSWTDPSIQNMNIFDHVFVKYGGGPWREKTLNRNVVKHNIDDERSFINITSLRN